MRSTRNVILKAVTWLSIILMLMGASTDNMVASMVLIFTGAAWLVPFSIANKEVER